MRQKAPLSEINTVDSTLSLGNSMSYGNAHWKGVFQDSQEVMSFLLCLTLLCSFPDTSPGSPQSHQLFPFLSTFGKLLKSNIRHQEISVLHEGCLQVFLTNCTWSEHVTYAFLLIFFLLHSPFSIHWEIAQGVLYTRFFHVCLVIASTSLALSLWSQCFPVPLPLDLQSSGTRKPKHPHQRLKNMVITGSQFSHQNQFNSAKRHESDPHPMKKSKYPHLLSPEFATHFFQSNVPIFHVTSLNKTLQLCN